MAKGKQTKPIKETKVKKVSAQGPIIVDSLFGRNQLSPPAGMSEYLKLYNQMPWVYACVYTIATSGAALPLRVFRKIDGATAEETEKADEKDKKPVPELEEVQPSGTPAGWEDVTDEEDKYWLVKILQNPNPSMTTYDLLESTIGYMELAGTMYWELAEMVNGLPGEIYPIRPTRMKTNLSRNAPTTISSYSFKMGTKTVRFSPEEILAFRYFNPVADYEGQGSVTAATDPLLLEQETVKYNKAFFSNDATPSGVIESANEMDKEDYERVSTQWRARHRGSKQQFKTAILPPGLSFKPIGQNFKEMGFEQLKKMNRQEILTVFGVPPVKVGLLEYAKYSNYNLQEKAFYQDTMKPKMLKIASSINKFLCPRFKKQGTFKVVFDMSEYLSDELKTRVEVFDKLFRLGAVNQNEIRKDLGIGGPIEGGDQYYVTQQVVPAGEETVERLDKLARGSSEAMETLVEELREKADVKDVQEMIDDELDTETEDDE
ncbi:MAG: phage portal protein [Lentisphaerae bacterium]|nr:phage portal protein [Lentisphaerota bacterium]